MPVIQKIVPNEEEQKKAIEQISSYDKNMRFWNKKCYEWGFYDRLEVRNPYLVELLKDKIRNKEAKKTCFLSEMFEDFTFYFEEQRKRLIYCREDYKEIRKIINDLCEKYPRIRDFIEENIFSDFNKDEQKALLEINQQFCNMINIVIEEVYKLGLEEDRL